MAAEDRRRKQDTHLRALAAVAIALTAAGPACGDDDNETPTATASGDRTAADDAAVAPTQPTTPPTTNNGARPRPDRRTVEVMLRSSPPGATVAVDGAKLGTTPQLWRGTFDGRAHDFVFSLKGHADSHYRFIPTHSGTVHGRLTRLPSIDTSAGDL